MYNIYKMSSADLTSDISERLYSAQKNIVTKYNLLNRFKDMDSYKKLFLSTLDGINNELFILDRDSSIYGILLCTRTADWNGNQQYRLAVSLCNSVIDNEVMESIDQLVQNLLNEHGELKLVTYNNELDKLVKRYTSKVALRANNYTLKKEDIDINMLNDAISIFEAKNKDLTIKYTDTISEEYINQYCDLFTETMEDMTDTSEDGYVQYVITPEKQRQLNDSNKERNITHNCYMIFNSLNEMVAKSNVSVNNNDPRFPYQFMIGVKRAYRGRSLGKWLYASMYKRLFENVDFEKTLVCHHPENMPAISISEWIGYKFNYLETTHILLIK